ncbi:MAG: succinate dehydrogenase/fumarate reductase iron-sulfur subunit [Deltaproteobacteria bacterium]|nr:succinate dehydrogenase/fumarate reductase iron-sulfur subunit [Deltaproteobacteria bacterium]
MRLHLKIWRQKNSQTSGKFVDYDVDGVVSDMSFLEMLDILNDSLSKKNEEPVTFDHDCREGICGSCGFMVNGLAHGGVPKTTVCQLYMRNFKDGDTVTVEPWRAQSFPVIKDLAVNRTAFDRIIASGGYISSTVGSATDGNTLPIPRPIAESAFDAAACIGCGACVAACKNASAMLFVSAKVTQMALLPQGQVERAERVEAMVAAMDEEKFGSCTNEAECSAVCPKGISFKTITRMNSEFIRANIFGSGNGE